MFERIKRLFNKREETTTTTSSCTRKSIRSGGTFSMLSTVTSPMCIATVYRCVQVISDSVACLRLQYMWKKGDRYVDNTTNPMHYLLTVQPQPEMSIYDFWGMAVRQMLLQGNAYIFPRYTEGEDDPYPTDLVLCSTGSVAHDPLNNTYQITDTYNGIYGTYREPDIIHLYLHSRDGRQGESVLSYARRTLAIATAGDVETGNRFENGGTVRGLVTNDHSTVGFGEYQDDQLEQTAESIDDRFQSGERIVSLPGQVDFKPISLSSSDMQFLESRKFTVSEICRFFGVNPSYVFADTSTNYKSAETANVAFLSTTLDPILKRIEAEFTRKLIPRSLCCKRVFRFDRRGIYSLDLEARADYQKKTIEAGIYTVNDWRRIENQPSVEGGDEVYISTNLARLGSDKLGTPTVNNSEAQKS